MSEWSSWAQNQKQQEQQPTQQQPQWNVWQHQQDSAAQNQAQTGAHVSDSSPWGTPQSPDAGANGSNGGWTTTNIYGSGGDGSSSGAVGGSGGNGAGRANYGVSGDGLNVGSSNGSNPEGSIGAAAGTSNSNNPLYYEPPQAPKQTPETPVGSAVPTSGSSGPGFISMAGWAFERGVAGYAGIVANRKYQTALQARMADGGLSTSETTTEELAGPSKSGVGALLLGTWAADTLLDRTVLSHKGTSWKTFAVDIGTPFLSTYLFGETSILKNVAISVGAHLLEKGLLEKTK